MRPLLRILLGVLAIFLLANPAGAEPNPCKSCEDLCQLMDQYLQREIGVELWKSYALSTPKEQRRRLPKNITHGGQLQSFIQFVFNMWTWERELPCRVMLGPWPESKDDGPNVSTDLEMVTQDGTCRVFYNKKEMDDQAKKEYENAVNCKVLSDATIEHEAVHQEHCKEAYRRNPKTAPEHLSDPAVVAESEFQAWSKQKDILADAIRQIIREKGCGWQPTEGQKKDPNSMPSIEQLKQMQARGWKTLEALERGTP